MTPGDSIVTIVAVYTWPFLFSGFTGCLIWIWKERISERAAAKFSDGVTAVRRNFDVELQNLATTAQQERYKLWGEHKEESRKIGERVQRLEHQVFGEDGGDGLRGEMRTLTAEVRRLSRSFDLWAIRENVELPPPQ